MTDMRLRLLQRKAQHDPTDVEGAWAYIRELERTHGVPQSASRDMLVPFKHYVRESTWVGGSKKYRIFDNYESINGMSFVALPFKQHYSNDQALLNAMDNFSSEEKEAYAHDIDVIADSIVNEEVSGYAVVDQAILQLLRDVNYGAGGDGASDAISAYKVAFCVSHAHTIKEWKYWLDDYQNSPLVLDNSGWKNGPLPALEEPEPLKEVSKEPEDFEDNEDNAVDDEAADKAARLLSLLSESGLNLDTEADW